MSRKEKNNLIRIAVCVAAFLVVLITDKTLDGGLAGAVGGRYGWLLPFALNLVIYLAIGYDVLWRAARNILHGQMLDENFLMCIATLGAFALAIYTGASGQDIEGFDEACAVLLFYQVGEFFQEYATGKSRKSISALMDIRPDSANVLRDGKTITVDPSEVQVGEIIAVNPGEKVPLDGTVTKGASSLDTRALTGESLPREVEEGMDVISGCINQSGVLHVRVTKEFSASTVVKILELVENAGSKKAKAENFITKFSRYYTPCVVIGAVLLAVLPPLISGGGGAVWSAWLNRALIFLVVSCPCALVISIPLSFFGGIGGASKCGVLVKGGNYLEALSKAEIVVFDKTGTLTKGVFNVTAVHPRQISESRLLELAALAEAYSDHPISRSLKEAYAKEIETNRIKSTEELPGLGICAKIEEDDVLVGNDKLMEKIGVTWHPCHHVGTTVHVAVNGSYAGHIVISDELKADAGRAIECLKAAGVKKTVMLTGDTDAVGQSVAQALKIDQAYTQLLPADKVEHVEALMKEKSPKGTLVFVGDGINDAPVLSRADVGIGMGAMGSDAAMEAADIVLMDDKPSKIALAIRISRKTVRLAYQNIVFALAIKALVLILGACGMANMWEAVFADVGVSVIAILNAMRALYIGKSASE